MSSSAPVVERPDGAVFAKAAVIPRGTPFVNDLSKAQVCLECGATEDQPSPECWYCAQRAADAAHATPAFGRANHRRAGSRRTLDDQRVDDLDRVCRRGDGGFAKSSDLGVRDHRGRTVPAGDRDTREAAAEPGHADV